MGVDVARITEDARTAALYYSTLIQNHVPKDEAVSLTGNYIFSLRIRQEPTEPWEDR